MNNKDTHELIEIAERLEEFIQRRGHDETPLEEHAAERYNGERYNTRKLASLFTNLEQDGYTALGFSLVLALINQHCLEKAGN